MQPVVTAICCAYNYAQWLPKALDSALAQGLGPDMLEVIVVDDGSTDDTPEVIKPYLESPIIRYVRKENGGFPSAVSRGFDEARGRYIVFLDADDEWPADRRLREQVDALERNAHVGIVYSDMEVIDEHGATTHPRFLEMIGIDPPSGQLLARLYANNVVSGGALMVRSELVPLFNPIPPGVRCQDWWMATRVASVAEILFVPGLVYRYRQHGANMNLGQADRTENLRDDLAFRRVVLTLPEADRLTPRELVDAAAPLIFTGMSYRGLASVSDAERAQAVSLRATVVELARAGRTEDAFRAFVRALALDPTYDPQPMFQELFAAGKLPEKRHADHRVLAFLDELFATPALVAEYAEAFAGREDVELVVVAPGLDGVAQQLEQELAPHARAVVVTEPAVDVAAVYTRLSRNGPLTAIPQVGDARELLRLVDRPTTLAIGFLDEVAASPQLLADYARAFDGRVDTRLALLAPQYAGAEQELEAALRPLVREIGLDRDGSADVVVVTDRHECEQVVLQAAAVYSKTRHNGTLSTLPHFRDATAFASLSLDELLAPVQFRCNVCGAANAAADFDREDASCACGSTPRWRSVVRGLSLALFDADLALPDFPSRPDILGVGMTDWEGYAVPLAQRLGYVNTYLHQEPFLDITNDNAKLQGQLDFILSSEVFEHVAPPVVDAFAKTRALLKPGGVLVLTVPWLPEGETDEHFPNLHDYDIVERGGRRVLVNTTTDGLREEFDDLVFHGGAGDTLELRLFARPSLERDLAAAGFGEVEILDTPTPVPHGVSWGNRASWPLLAWVPDPLPLETDAAERVVVRLDDLVASPELLSTAAAALRGRDAVLVVYAPDAHPAGASALFEGVDLDVLLLAVPASRSVERRLADAATAVLGEPTGSFTRLPRLDTRTESVSDRTVRYGWAAGLVAGLDVLDLGCGSGHGSEILTWTAARVRGFDLARPEHPEWPGGAELTFGHDLARDPLPKADAAVLFDAPDAVRNAWGAADLLIVSLSCEASLEQLESELRAAGPVQIEHLHQDGGLILPGRNDRAAHRLVVARKP